MLSNKKKAKISVVKNTTDILNWGRCKGKRHCKLFDPSIRNNLPCLFFLFYIIAGKLIIFAIVISALFDVSEKYVCSNLTLHDCFIRSGHNICQICFPVGTIISSSI